MTNVSSEIVNMQNQTTYTNYENGKNRTSSTDITDSNMFLTLMLKQLEQQDPTQPTDNTQWLAQLAQYSSMEQMAQMNSGLGKLADCMNALYTDNAINSEINQTLSLIGKEVTIKDPEDLTGESKITGKVTEASFEDGTGKVKIGDEYYSIANIVSVRVN